jgi:hypothetical protein
MGCLARIRNETGSTEIDQQTTSDSEKWTLPLNGKRRDP